MEHESDGDTNCNCAFGSHKRIGTGIGGFGNKRTSRDHPNYSIVKIGQNTEKSPGDLSPQDSSQYSVTQTFCHSNSSEKPSANAGMKNSQKRKIIMIVYSWCTTSIDFPDLSPFISIIHCSQKVFQATTCISTKLLSVVSSWSPNTCSSMWRSPLEYIAYAFILTSPAVSCMSCSSNLDIFQDGWQVGLQLLFCRMLPPWFVHHSSKQSCAIVIKFFLYTLCQCLCGASI